MKASVELLSGIVRAGVNHNKYGDPYERVVTWSSIDGRTAVLKAFVSDGKENMLPYVRAATNALRALGFECVTWERARDMEYPNKDEAKKPDGTIDHEVIKAHLPKVVEAMETNGDKIVGLGQYNTAETAPAIPSGSMRHYFDVVHGQS